MTSIIQEILHIRKGDYPVIDRNNRNRYRIVAIEPDGSRTAYYFATPIYHQATRKMIDLKFHEDGEKIYATGSNASLTFSDSIRMENADGSCQVAPFGHISRISEHELSFGGNGRVTLTTNGFACFLPCGGKESIPFELEVSEPYPDIRANDRCFALMKESFRPFLSVCCIGTVGASGHIIAPAKLICQKLTDRRFTLSFVPCSPMGKGVLLEANLYEAKLFQDTTVESGHAGVNNAFGSIGFIGHTTEYGEQWLYSRPDHSRMPELGDKRILRAVWHIPRWNCTTADMTAYRLLTRFCSFGSTWEHKIPATSAVSNSATEYSFVRMDLTDILSDRHGRFVPSEGILLKASGTQNAFSVISTGDCYLRPQILEVSYR